MFIFQVVRRVIMACDRDRGGNLRPVQWVTLWERDGLLSEEKLELKLLGLRAIRNKWGSIRVMVDDDRGEMAGVMSEEGVRFTHGKHTPYKHMHARPNTPTHPHGQASTNRDSWQTHTQSQTGDAQSLQLTPSQSISVRLTHTLTAVQTHTSRVALQTDIQMISGERAQTPTTASILISPVVRS